MAGCAPRSGWRRFRVIRSGAVAVAVAAVVVPLGAASAQASGAPGALRLTVTKAVAGTSGATLGWTYTAPRQAVTGTISIDVPAAFGVPQASDPGSAGYVSATSADCAQFQVSGVSGQPDGSALVTIAVQCTAQQTGSVSYAGVAVPTAAGRYGFAATFTPAGSPAVPFTQGHTVIVTHAPLASLVLTPGAAIIAPGAMQAYTVHGFDAYGNPLGNVTASTQFAIAPDGSCTAASCTATTLGRHIVTATDGGVKEAVTLTVAEADLSVTETVSNTSPYYYAPVTFTTTVTNLSSRFTARGVRVAVNEPAGLISPSASSTSYNPASGSWTIGALAPGASVTLTITGDAGDVAAGTQTVTATVTATTYDPNPANNTASASEASQPAPLDAVITPDPNNQNPIDVCQPPTVTDTWDGAAVNAINPAAPPPAPGSFSYVWTCTAASGEACPAPANNSYDSPDFTFTADTLALDSYTLDLAIIPGGTDPNYQASTVSSDYTFTTICSG